MGPSRAEIEHAKAGVDAFVVPRGIVATEFDLQTTQPFRADPLAEQNGVAVLRLCAREVCGLQRIEPTHEMPHREAHLF